MEEIWLPVVDWEYYEVSNLGRVRSLNKIAKHRFGFQVRKGKILTNTINNTGYESVNLVDSSSGRNKNTLVHRMVAEAFIPNPEELPVINHKNQIKTDNRVENLEWCSRLYNNCYEGRHLEIGRKQHIIVYQYDMEKNFIKEWASAGIAAEVGGFDNSTIGKVARGKRPHHRNFIWSYVPLHK